VWEKTAQYVETVSMRTAAFGPETDEQLDSMRGLVARLRSGSIDVQLPYVMGVSVEKESDSTLVYVLLLASAQTFPYELRLTNGAGLDIRVALDNELHRPFSNPEYWTLAVFPTSFRIEHATDVGAERRKVRLSERRPSVQTHLISEERWNVWVDGRLISDEHTVHIWCE
jgi:hypothetical protein